MTERIKCGNCHKFTDYDGQVTQCEHCGATNLVQDGALIVKSSMELESLIEIFFVSTEVMDMEDDDLIDEVASLFVVNEFSFGQELIMKNTFLHRLTNEERWVLQATYVLAHTDYMLEE